MIEFTRTGDPRKDRVLQYIAKRLNKSSPDVQGRVALMARKDGLDYDMVAFEFSNGVSNEFTFRAVQIEMVDVEDAGSTANEIEGFISEFEAAERGWSAKGYYPGASEEAQ